MEDWLKQEQARVRPATWNSLANEAKKDGRLTLIYIDPNTGERVTETVERWL